MDHLERRSTEPECIVLPVGLNGCHLRRVEKHLHRVFPDFKNRINGLGVRILLRRERITYIAVGAFICWEELDLGMREARQILDKIHYFLPEPPRSVGIFLPRRRLNGHIKDLQAHSFPFTLNIHEAEH